jgi:hypothetical protein
MAVSGGHRHRPDRCEAGVAAGRGSDVASRTRVQSVPQLGAESWPTARAIVAAKSSIHMLIGSIWEAFGYETGTALSSRHSAGLPVGDLGVLALSEQAARCLRDGQVLTIYELLESTEEELLKLPNLNRRMLEEIGQRLMATGFVLSDGREAPFGAAQTLVPSQRANEADTEQDRVAHESSDQARLEERPE